MSRVSSCQNSRCVRSVACAGLSLTLGCRSHHPRGPCRHCCLHCKVVGCFLELPARAHVLCSINDFAPTADKPFVFGLPSLHTRNSSSSSRRETSRPSFILSPCSVDSNVKCQLQICRYLQHARVRRPPKRPLRVLPHLHVPRVLFTQCVPL